MSVDMKLAVLETGALILLLLSLIVLLGHWLNLEELTRLGTDTAMSPLTAGGFIVIAISKFVLASALKKRK